jgi:hypothetical protein
MVTRLSAHYDKGGNYFVNVTTGGFGLTTDQRQGSLKYITGLLNSRVLDWYFKRVSTSFHGGYLAANKQFLIQLPMRVIDLLDNNDKAKHDKMVALVERMMDLHDRLAKAKAPDDKTKLQRQIDATDHEIDRLVYDLYGLTEEEVKIVELATS